MGCQLARCMRSIQQRLAAQDGVLERIQERLDSGQKILNLNVRAPKRTGTYSAPVTRGMALGNRRPLPLARFLDEKEAADSSWARVRRSFSPCFGMLTQVLKKKRLAEEGVRPTYVEQNHRAQLLYTEEDRGMMEEAWALTTAHREELCGQLASERPTRTERPNVLELLRRP